MFIIFPAIESSNMKSPPPSRDTEQHGNPDFTRAEQ